MNKTGILAVDWRQMLGWVAVTDNVQSLAAADAAFTSDHLVAS